MSVENENEIVEDAAPITETPPVVDAVIEEGAASEESVPSPPLAEEAAVQEAAASTEAEPNTGANNDYSNTLPTLNQGDVVKGVVVHIDREGVLVDVGMKSEGLIRLNELSRDAALQPEEVVHVGDQIDVYVLETEDKEGTLILSKKRADFEKAWERVQQAKESGTIISAMVSDRVKGGLVVDLGIRGFVPASHVASGSKANLDRYIGQSIPLKVLEVDKERRKVILSHRLAVEEERQHRKETTFSSLGVGQIRRGHVRRITEFGAFVDLGGVDGLLHISEMAWTRLKHPSEVLKEGDDIEVIILKIDRDQNRISLGRRQILPDPWSDIANRYHSGQVITGTVSRLVPFGAFVLVEGGVEGIIPNSELSTRHVSRANMVVNVGDSVEVRVLDVRPDERKMTLSLRQARSEAETQRERQEIEQHVNTREEPRFTIGDAIRAQRENGADFLTAELDESKERRSRRRRSRTRHNAPERSDEENDADNEAG
ncbi:MAG: 30S ribosomal protein S1 [Armatimonadetes bacterium]|nr:30S ribosomal protein S1 [Armatimonadota bacterium]